MRQRKQVKTDHAVSTAHVGLADQKNELTHSSAFYELPAWVGINPGHRQPSVDRR